MAYIDKKYHRFSWEVETPEKGTWARGETADIKFYQSSYWRKIRASILSRDNHLCQECKRQDKIKEGIYVDHIINKHHGGNDDFENLEVLCASCHNTKTAKERRR
jgi:5-methylcytosine-specific restriction enzyme A